MSAGPPKPPPKRKNHKLVASYGTAGSGASIARALKDTKFERSEDERSEDERPPHRHERIPDRRVSDLSDESPDAVIGEGVEINGEFQFDRLLRIDGKFQGTLLSHSQGDVVVGATGCIVADVIVVRRIVVEGGRVVGKIVADEVLLMDRSVIRGDITCKVLAIEGPSVAITGRANVHPLAPSLIDAYDNILTEVPKKVKKPKGIFRSPGAGESDGSVGMGGSGGGVGVGDRNAQVQTNASAKPSRRSQGIDEEEAASVEQAQMEHNAIKERRRQRKAQGGGAGTGDVTGDGEGGDDLADIKFLPSKSPKPGLGRVMSTATAAETHKAAEGL
ncbi:hypothetical protein B484DRAFT_405512, partial [Ochromonadaceae sp. CCMP2298]